MAERSRDLSSDDADFAAAFEDERLHAFESFAPVC